MRKIEFAKGQRVRIFTDPVTMQDPEGIAVLTSFVCKAHYSPYEETWKVRFVDDQDPADYYRTIINDPRVTKI